MVAGGTSTGDSACDAISYTILVFAGIAIYNVIELSVIISTTFKRRSGCYFWSFIIATYGIAIYAVGVILREQAAGIPNYIYDSINIVGWVAMVTGQSMVLWSRLHLVLRNRFRLRLVLAMIIFNAIIGHGTDIVLIYGADATNSPGWLNGFNIYERIQISLFFAQELIISGIYIYETVNLMKLESTLQIRNRSRYLMKYLICVNAVVILLDIVILAVEYSGYYRIQTAYKGFAYSVKLKLEFTILNKIVEIARDKSWADGIQHQNDGRATTSIASTIRDANFIHDGGHHPQVSYAAYAEGGLGLNRATERSQNSNGGREVILTTEISMQSEENPIVDD